MLGGEQALVATQTAAVTGHLGALAVGHHLVEGHPHVDGAADEAWVDRVVVGVDAHVVVPGQADVEPQ